MSSKLTYWRTGFYYIALEAKVPIAMAVMDYGKREIGVKTSFMPTGDLEADLNIIRDFYKDVKGKHPEKTGPIATKPK